MTHLDHSTKPIKAEDNPDGICEVCSRKKSHHTAQEANNCKQAKLANSGEMAGVRFYKFGYK